MGPLCQQMLQDSLSVRLVCSKCVERLIINLNLIDAVTFSSMILWWVRMLNDFEVQGETVPLL